jgi:hypothetical protein
MTNAFRGLRMAGIIVVAGLVAGTALGAGMRLAMRIVALTDGSPGTRFTVAGTLLILIVVNVLLLPVAALFLAVRRLFKGSPRRRGAIFGLWLVVPFLALPAREAIEIGFVPLNVVMFGSLIVLYGVVLSVTMSRLERRIRRPGGARAASLRSADGVVVPASG